MTRTTKTTTRKPTPNANKVNVNANKVKVNANKVGINAAKVRANSAKVAANAASVKANAAKAKVTPKVSATKPLADNKVKTATAVRTPKAIETRGKSFLIENDRGLRQYGTNLQRDSSLRAQRLWNEGGNSKVYPGANREISGIRTKQGYDREFAKYKNDPKMLNYLATTTRGKVKYEDLPNYVATKNTGAGKYLREPEVKNATGTGGCKKGYSLDRNGNCVRTSPY